MTTSGKPKKVHRTSAREAAVQALFQIALARTPPARVIEQFLDRPATDSNVLHKTRFRRIVAGVAQSTAEIDGTIRPLLGENWSLERLDTTLLCVLRCAVWELLYGPDSTPARVVITEYLKICYGFSEDREVKFANALLDRVARSARVSEFA